MKHRGQRRKFSFEETKLRHVVVPEAESRLSRAIDMLLRSAAKELEGSTNAKKEEEPPEGSRPEKIAGQNDGEKR